MHRLLATLEKRRFVQFDRAESKWHVGAQSFSVGATFTRRRNFVAQAMPYLRKLRDLTRETANLAVVDDESIIVLTRMESREIMRSLTKVGGRVAMVASGGGKAVLATWSDDDVNAIIHRQGMPRLTEKSIVRPSDLFKELETIRRQGYAVDDEEARIGLRCVAAVVYSDCSEPLAAISVSGMTSRVTEERVPALGNAVREVAAELTAALGGVMPGGNRSERCGEFRLSLRAETSVRSRPYTCRGGPAKRWTSRRTLEVAARTLGANPKINLMSQSGVPK